MPPTADLLFRAIRASFISFYMALSVEEFVLNPYFSSVKILNLSK